jgi:S1-C subfamily serine protease
MSSNIKTSLLSLTLILTSLSTGCVRTPTTPQEQPATPQPQSSTTPVANPSNPPVTNSNSEGNPNYVAQVVQQVGSAVVRVNSTRTLQQPTSDPYLRRFFGGQSPTQQQVQRGTGSGFIMSQDGRILTNAHVVEDVDTVSVVLKDGRRFDAKVLGIDRVTDVAVLKIEATGLPTARLGNSDNLQPGQAAIAIGNPLGLDNTVTEGIISATGRSSSDVGVPAERVRFIQTDAAINPGNSGGPLLNSNGEVIGINTAIIQGAQGIGFAIPINTAQQVAEQLITKGQVSHPYLGVLMTDLTPELRDQINRSNVGFQVNQTTGVLVVKVAENSPAARAGLRPGDVIVKVNNDAIQNTEQVQQKVEAAQLNNPLPMTVQRNDRSVAVNVRPTQLPPPDAS